MAGALHADGGGVYVIGRPGSQNGNSVSHHDMEALMSLSPTPISLIESYFDHDLKRSSLRFFDEVKDDTWIDFAKNYLAQMEKDFASGFLEASKETDKQVRLYFEPRLAENWDRAVKQFYHPTPLLGLSPLPPETKLNQQQVSRLLDPLKKHLLFAHSVFIRDNFYYCFDHVADSVDKSKWRSDPNTQRLVVGSIRSIKRWLPILIELRDFIEAGILVFMPYYITPSFPYGGTSPKLRKEYERLRLRPDTSQPPPKPAHFDLSSWNDPPKINRTGPPTVQASSDDVTAAWLNGRLLGLDVVFPDRAAFELGSRLYFHEDSEPWDVTTDLVSIEGLPFGAKTGLGLKELWKIRKNEKIFDEVRTTVADCKLHLEANLGVGSTKVAANEMCHTYLSDRLKKMRGEPTLRFLEKPVPSVVTSIVVGVSVAVVTANPAFGVMAGAILNPSFVRVVEDRTSHKRRAIGQLQALL
jgi:hypothetical protein